MLGGSAVPAIGFAAGLERLVLAAGEATGRARGPDLFLVTLGDAAKREALKLAAGARRAGLWTELDLRSGSVKSQMRRADKLGAALVAVIGDGELASGSAKLKQLGARGPGKPGDEQAAPLEKLAAEALRQLGANGGGTP